MCGVTSILFVNKSQVVNMSFCVGFPLISSYHEKSISNFGDSSPKQNKNTKLEHFQGSIDMGFPSSSPI
jgi:hypothetical protein